MPVDGYALGAEVVREIQADQVLIVAVDDNMSPRGMFF
jgi:hypothetical protein